MRSSPRLAKKNGVSESLASHHRQTQPLSANRDIRSRVNHRTQRQTKQTQRSAARRPQPRGVGFAVRDLVHARLSECAHRFPDLPIDVLDVPEIDELESRDAALARTILRQTTMRWLTLRALLKHVLHKGFDEQAAPVKAGLLCGAAQIVLLDRIPAHAAINESVKWVGRISGQQPAGLVNAVLRKLADLVGDVTDGLWTGERNAVPIMDGGVRLLHEPMLPVKQIERWASATGITRPFLEQCIEQFGLDRAREIALQSIAQPPTIIRIPCEMTRETIVAAMDRSLRERVDEHLLWHDDGGHCVFTGTKPDLESMLGAVPMMRVQDPASSASLQLLTETFGESYTPRVIVDLCAGKGTKTLQLADMFPEAMIHTTDIDAKRFDDLSRMVRERPGLVSRVHVHTYDNLVRGQQDAATGIFADLVVLDVPCSNSGVLARRPEARFRQTPEDHAKMVELQQSIVNLGSTFRAERGVLLYATCSLIRSENEGIAEISAAQLGLRVKASRSILPQGPGPCQWHDGSFASVLG